MILDMEVSYSCALILKEPMDAYLKLPWHLFDDI